MKFKNLATMTKHTGLYATLMIAVAACQSDEQKLARMDNEIVRLEEKIDSTHIYNEATDSAARNTTLTFLRKWIEEDTPRIDSLRERNWGLTDSIQKRNVLRASGKYPLNEFLSKEDIKIICAQLRDYHSQWNKKNVANIIGGRGTLLDLYNIVFDLDYNDYEPPFHIVNDLGYVRFDNPRLDKRCQEFENEKVALETEEIKNQIRRRAIQKEFADNERQIQDYERKCVISDSLYMEIEAHFRPQITHRIDSMTHRRDSLRAERNALFSKMKQK